MPVTPDDVRHVAALARLDLDPEEVESFTRQLSEILEHVDALERAEGSSAADEAGDVDSAATGAPEAGRSAPLRADEPGADPLGTPLSALAPRWEQGFFVVPRLASHEEDDGGSDRAPEP